MAISLYRHNAQLIVSEADDWPTLADLFIDTLHNYYGSDPAILDYCQRASWIFNVMDAINGRPNAYQAFIFGGTKDHPEYMIEVWPTPFPATPVMDKPPF